MHAAPDIETIETTKALLQAVHFGSYRKIDEIIESGFDVNTPNKEGVCALMVASRQNLKKSMKKLLDAGARVDVCDMQGDTVLHYAVKSPELDYCIKIFDILLKAGADLEARNKLAQTPLCALLDLMSDNDNKVDKGHVALFFRMMDAGANHNAKDDAGRSPKTLFRGCINTLNQDDFNAMRSVFERLDLVQRTPNLQTAQRNLRI